MAQTASLSPSAAKVKCCSGVGRGGRSGSGGHLGEGEASDSLPQASAGVMSWISPST